MRESKKTACALVLAALGLLAPLLGCSSSQTGSAPGDAGGNGVDAGPVSVTGIDGTWDITFTGNATYTNGTMYVSPTVAQVKFRLAEEGTPQGPDCTYVASDDEINLDLSSDKINGTNTHLQQIEGNGCPLDQAPGTSIVRHDLPGQDLATRMSTASSAFGKLGGTWSVMTPRGACQVTFRDMTVTGQCDTTTFTGTLNGSDLTGMAPEAGFEFAAHLH